MDDNPKCSDNAEPSLQKPTQKDESASLKDQTSLSEAEFTGMEPQTVLIKEIVLNCEGQTTAPKHQPIYIIDQPLDLKDQLNISKEQTATIIEHHPFSPEEQVVLPIIHFDYNIDEPSSSKEQKNSEFLKDTAKDGLSSPEEQPTLSLIHIDYLNGESSSSKEKTATEIHVDIEKDEPTSPEDLTTLSIIHIDFPICESSSSKEQPVKEIHLGIAKGEPNSPAEEQTTLSIIHIDSPIGSSKEKTATEIHVDIEKDETTSPEERILLPIIHVDSNIDEPSSKEQNRSETHIDEAKDKPTSPDKQKTLSVIQIDTSVGESSSSKEQTGNEIHIDTAKDEMISSGELATAQKIQIDPTRGELSTPKDHVMGNYSGRRSPNIAVSGSFLCLEKAASASLSFETKNYSYLCSNAPLKINSSTQGPIKSQPVSQLPVPASVAVGTGPASLFLQALSKLEDSSFTLSIASHCGLQTNLSNAGNFGSGDLSPPDSLLSAPPTYSFVLRQMAIRRRPRYMGTFIPSPSFVQQTPPPTYTGAYDVYIEPAVPPPPPRVYTYGFASMPIVCPECGFAGMTVVISHVTICTHLCALVLCLLCCWICAPLPYILRSCKEVYHYCRNCRSFLGMYCPTNPENVYANN